MANSQYIQTTGTTPSLWVPATYPDSGAINAIAGISSLQFWTRGDAYNAAPGGSNKFALTDLRPSSTRVLNQASSQVGTATPRVNRWMGRRPTIEFDTGTDTVLTANFNPMPATGPFAIYTALEPLTASCRVGGNTATTTQLRLNLVNTQIRMEISATSSLSVTIPGLVTTDGVLMRGRETIIGFLRRTDGDRTRLVIRYKIPGGTWVETASANYATSDGTVTGTPVSIATSFSLGVITASTGYSFASQFSQLMIFNADLTAGQQATVEDYLANYHGQLTKYV